MPLSPLLQPLGTTILLCFCEFDSFVCVLSHVQFFVTPWTIVHQAPLAPLPMEFSKQEYWSRLPFTTPGVLPYLEIEPVSLESPALASGFFTTAPAGKPFRCLI